VRPDYQELLADVRLAVWVRHGDTEQAPTLAERLAAALREPASVARFGGLALGESTHLVDEARLLRPSDGAVGEYLLRDELGPLTLPVWPDHVSSAASGWVQVRLEERPLAGGPRDDCWIALRPG
jgi:CRISPR-associated protein Cas5t